MINPRTTESSEHFFGSILSVGKVTQPVHRKQTKDPMKLFPYLFQFVSPRLSQADKLAATSDQAAPDRKSAQDSLFLAFRSPSDQQCVIAVPSYQVYDRPKSRFQHWMH
jgi:hypothetical protein